MLDIKIQGFSTEDDQYYYIDLVRAAACSNDSSVTIDLHKTSDRVVGHVKPSNPDFKQGIIDNLLAAHRMLGLKIIFSSSLKISNTVSYSVNI